VEIHGDESEFRRALVDAYPGLLRYAEGLAGSRAEAWDLVQETMERGLRHRQRFQHGDAPNGWLTTILRRIFIDRYRQSRTTTRLSRRWTREELSAREEDEGMEEETASDRFSGEDVRRALMFVRPVFRIPYALFTFDRLSYGEIGRRLSLTPGTVASRVFRARQRLREVLISGDFRLRAIGSVQTDLPASPAWGPPPQRLVRPLRARARRAASSSAQPTLEATG
jgi:RNA polymerase sigma-70 factor (ECF subfamily)